jgi:hypothetical protein
MVAPAVVLPLLPAMRGRQRRTVDARLAHPLGLRLHQLPGPARRHLPRLRRRHRRTRTGQPRQPGRCDLTGLPLPPPRPPGVTTFSCTSDPAGTPAVALPAGGHVLAAQQHTDALISALLASRGQPAEAPAPPASWDVIEESHAGKQSTLLVRASGPVLDPAWTVRPVSLEDMVLAYMSQPGDAARADLAGLEIAS